MLNKIMKLKQESCKFSLMALFVVLLASIASTAKATPKLNSDGYYEIWSASDLKWFAEQVNSGQESINGILTANIRLSDLSESVWTPIGSIDTKNAVYHKYSGTFDGDGFSIYGLVVPKQSGGGLFGYLAGAKVKNVYIDGVSVSNEFISSALSQGLGALAGIANGATITDCKVLNAEMTVTADADYQAIDAVGGVVGICFDHTTIDGCYFQGYVMTNTQYVGSIVGAAQTSAITDCHVISTSNDATKICGGNYAGGIVGLCSNRSGVSTVTDCLVGDSAEVATTTDNGNKGTLYGGEIYTDDPSEYDGYYEIYTADHLKSFASKVNGGQTTISAKLMNDIDMADAGEFTPIGSESNKFAGEFDGQKHTISNLTIKSQKYAGLIGYMINNKVHDVNFKSPKLNPADNDYQGIVVGWLTKGDSPATISNCHVTDGSIQRDGSGTPDYVGGIAGKADVAANIEDCSFQGTINATENRIGGIVGELNSGASVTRCYTIGHTYIKGVDYVGGIAGLVEDNATSVTDCYLDQSNGAVDVACESGNSSGDIWGKNNSTSTGKHTIYKEDYLQYELTGKKIGNAYECKVTGLYDTSETTVHLINDIGTSNDYKTTEISRLNGVKVIDKFIDCNSNIAGTEASSWIDMKIDDYAFDSNFQAMYMRYLIYAGDDHLMMLRPSDVKPAGKNMFANCPNAKVYVDAEYYNEFVTDSLWSQYADHIVSTTAMRNTTQVTDFTEKGVQYQYDRNRDNTGSYITQKSTVNGSTNVRQVHVVGCDDSKIENEVLQIYQDIGETYAYNTTKVWTSAFKGKSSFHTVRFEQIMSDASSVYSDFKIELGDSCFANNSALKYFDVALSSDKGYDHYDVIHPAQMPLGKGVFDNCPNLKIRIPRLYMDEFEADASWSQYKDKFEATDFDVKSFTEDGVKYAYYISNDGKTRYTSKNYSDMLDMTKPWASYYQNFSTNKLLGTEDYDGTIYYLRVNGVDDATIDDKKGVMKIYNDIGNYYNYKTIELSANAMRENTHIKSVIFEDCAGSSGNSNTDLCLAIPDEAFRGCSNLTDFYLYYYVTKGSNHYEALEPSQIFIGKDVFKDCAKNFKIHVLPELYSEFVNDANWSQYKDYIVANDYVPTGKDAVTVNDVVYDYASHSLNTVETSETVRLESSAWNALTIGIVAAITIASWGTITFSLVAGETAAASIADTIYAVINIAVMAVLPTVESETIAGMVGILALTYLTPVVTAALVAAPALGITGLVNYIGNRVKKNYGRSSSWKMHGPWIRTEQRTNVPLMYVKSVPDAESVRIYNDPGEDSEDFRTVCIAKDAFQNKKNLKEVEFHDRYGASSESLNGMMMVMPDSCFYGCDKFEKLNLIMWSNGDDHGRHTALTPDNFIITKDFLAGCDTTKLRIYVGSDVLDEFLEDEYWGKYKTMYRTQDIEQKTDHTEWRVRYSLAYNNNTIPLKTQSQGHDIDHYNVIGADESSLKKSSDGLAALINDWGCYDNTKLDAVTKKAFKGNKDLKILDITDSHTNWGDVYCDFECEFQDSAFADCPNFTDLNLIYQKTDGDNESKTLAPSQITLGKGVFAGSDKLRIKICLDQEEAFLADTSWNKYAKQIYPCFFDPQDKRIYTLLKDKYRFYTDLNSGTDWNHIDVTRMSLDDIKTVFKGTGIESFEEFRAFKSIGCNTIYNGMFEGCEFLCRIELPDTTRTIETNAFKNCKYLYDLTIPATVKDIQANAFTGSGLKRIVMKQTAVPAFTDYENAFAGLPSDYVIYVPDSLETNYKTKWTAIADHINRYSQKRGLVTVKVTKAGTLADALGITYDYGSDIKVTGNYAQYDSLRIIGPLDGRDIGLLRYMGGRNVEYNEKSYGGHLKYLDLYEANLRFSKEKYEYNRKGENDYIQANDQVDTYMFWKLDQLETLILPKSAKTIKKCAISNCQNLKTIVVGDNVTKVEKWVVDNCPNIEYLVMLPKSKPDTHEDAWNAEDTHFSAVLTLPSSVESYSNDIAYTGQADTIIYNFKDEALLERMKKMHVFSPIDMINMANVSGYVNDTEGITNFTELICATKVTTLGDNTLTNMSDLEEVALPLYCGEIKANAFKGCKKLKTIWAIGYTIPVLEEGVFDDIDPTFVIWVAEGLEDIYRKAWPQYANHIQGYRSSRTNITEVTVTEPGQLAEKLGINVTVDGRYIKSISGTNMSTITGLKINGPISSTDIAVIRMLAGRDYDYENTVYATCLKYLDLYNAEIKADTKKIYYTTSGDNEYVEKDNVIPKKFLRLCDHLETVILPKTATKIEDDAFYDMYSLKTLVIGDETNDVDGNDAFGESHNLTKMIFLSKTKPALNHDAFTDPSSGAEGDVYKVANMYVRRGLHDQYATDSEYTSHASSITAEFDNDDLFCAYGSKAYATTDDLTAVDSITGWFKPFTGITDLTTLSKTRIKKISKDDLSTLTDLTRIQTPATLTKVEDSAFANNENLHWADLSASEALDINVNNLGLNKDALLYVPAACATETANVVYGSDGNFQCAEFNLTNARDYDVPNAFTAKKVTFDRTFAAYKVTTLTLPFATTVPEGMKAYLLDTDSKLLNQMRFNRKPSMEALTPYVVKTGDADVNGFELEGEYNVAATPSRSTAVTAKGYQMTGIVAGIDNATAKSGSLMVMDDAATWNVVDAQNLDPFTGYITVTNTTASTKDVASTLLDYSDMEVDELYENKDNNQTIADNEGATVNVKLVRTLEANKWYMVCVPFDMPVKYSPLKGSIVMKLSEVEDDGKFVFADVDNLKAGEAYAVMPSSNLTAPVFNSIVVSEGESAQAATVDYAVTGVYSPTKVAADAATDIYTLETSGQLMKVTESTVVKGTSAYFTVPSGQACSTNLKDITSGIEDIVNATVESGDNRIYNILGQYLGTDLDRLPRGIYIQNGKKIVKQ